MVEVAGAVAAGEGTPAPRLAALCAEACARLVDGEPPLLDHRRRRVRARPSAAGPRAERDGEARCLGDPWAGGAHERLVRGQAAPSVAEAAGDPERDAGAL